MRPARLSALYDVNGGALDCGSMAAALTTDQP
jgi:hypothetical protein